MLGTVDVNPSPGGVRNVLTVVALVLLVQYYLVVTKQNHLKTGIVTLVVCMYACMNNSIDLKLEGDG